MSGDDYPLGKKIVDLFITLIVAVAVLYALLLYLHVTGRATPSIDVVIGTLILGVLTIEIIGLVIYLYFRSRIVKEEAGPLRNLFRTAAYIILLLIILAIIYPNLLGGLLISGGFLGIVFGLAAQSTISNFISGIYLISSKAFEPGDHVIIHTWQYTLQPPTYPHGKFVPGFAGTIKSIGVLYTEFINEESLPMLVPNSIVAQAMVINYHRAKEHMTRIQFDVDIRIKYTDLEEMIKKVAKEEKLTLYKVDIESLHDNLYVVSMHMKLDEEERTRMKTKIYTELIKYLNREHKRLSR
jgi:small conductance mechanosensitive channel